MDLISLAIAVAFFAAMVVAIELLERVWAPPTPCSSRSRWPCSPTSRSRCSEGSGS